jgi:hypothetical protein
MTDIVATVNPSLIVGLLPHLDITGEYYTEIFAGFWASRSTGCNGVSGGDHRSRLGSWSDDAAAGWERPPLSLPYPRNKMEDCWIRDEGLR